MAQVMAIFLLACKETVTIKKILIWIVPLHFNFCRLLSSMVPFQRELMLSNNILAFSVGLFGFIL